MLGRLIPRDQEFFTLFNQLATHLLQAARQLKELFEDPANLLDKVRAIKDVEHMADKLTHEINERIDRSFITPIDREDIHVLSTRLDDVIDLLDGTARRAEIYQIESIRPHARQLSALVLQATEHLQRGVAGIKRPREVNNCAVEVKRIEEEGDAVYHEALALLFAGKPEPIEVIQWKEMYDRLEQAIDACMGVVHSLQSISLKNT